MLFPCNQFGKQEPKSEPEIKEFARKVGILDLDPPCCDMFMKCDSNGDDTHDVFKFLRSADLQPGKKGLSDKQKVGEPVGWNFCKWVVGRDGQVKGRFGPGRNPKEMDVAAGLPAWLKEEVAAPASEPEPEKEEPNPLVQAEEGVPPAAEPEPAAAEPEAEAEPAAEPEAEAEPAAEPEAEAEPAAEAEVEPAAEPQAEAEPAAEPAAETPQQDGGGE